VTVGEKELNGLVRSAFLRSGGRLVANLGRIEKQPSRTFMIALTDKRFRRLYIPNWRHNHAQEQA
jgi:hypothetical protein